MKKAAVYIHGWAMDDRIFHRKWIRELGAPVFTMMKEEFGYDPIPLSLPGHYLHMDKDFDWYAEFIMDKLEKIEDLEDVVLIGHSMGSVTIRKLLQTVHDPERERLKRKISRAILIGSPNHGTGQPLANTLSKAITTIGQKILPRDVSQLTKANRSFLEETPCYRDLNPDGDFMRELNDESEFPLWIKVDNIWTLADTVVEPAHSAILPGVPNHLIDPLSMNHFNMLYRKETVDKVRSIMKGTARPGGPQDLPDPSSCEEGGGHEWWPEYVMPLMHEQIHWRCKSCGKETLSHLLPEPLGCDNSFLNEGPHHWSRVKRSYSFKYKCRKCNESIWYPNLDE